jgi:hypothetical protein
LQVALTGLVTITAYKIMFTGFKTGTGIAGFGVHMAHEWVLLANLLGLLVGFALLARHFEDSGVPEVLPRLLPEGWMGPFMLLVIIFVLSGFLDNIAAALIGATVAASVFKAQGAYRLPGCHRRRVEWRRCRFGGRRHDDDHDVAGRRQPARRCRGLHCRRRGAGGIRHSGGACCSTSTWQSAAISRPRTTSTGRGSASSSSS